MNPGSGWELIETPYTFSVIKPKLNLSYHPLKCTFSNTNPEQGFVALHLIIPGGSNPPSDVTFLKVMFVTVTRGYVGHSGSRG